MRSLKLKPAKSGFSILTGILMLAFVVSIIYAASDGGTTDNVSWSIWVGSLSYNSITDISSSSHSVYVTNNSAITVYVEYEFKHSIDNREAHTLRDMDWDISVSPNTQFSHSNTITRSNGDVGAGNHTLSAYTRVVVRKNLGWPPFITGGPVTETLNFTK